MSWKWMGDPYEAQLRAAKAEGELARIKDALREFAEDNGFNPEMEPRDLLAKATGSFRSCAAMSDARYEEIRELKAEMEAMRPRPAPKVLDADGAEIRVGDTVWWTRNYTGTFCVESITLSGKCVIMDDDPDEPCGMTLPPEQLTHRAPVLAADGKPLREGETVYLTDSPTAFVVDDIMTREDGATVVHLKDGAWHLPQYLTHERPDSWERIEADCMQDAKDYCEEHGIEPEYPKHIGKAKCEDLVRRAKKLAERDR